MPCRVFSIPFSKTCFGEYKSEYIYCIYLLVNFLFQMETSDYSKSLIIDINGQKMCIDGVTRYTTCDDVIEMAFYNCPVDTDSYALFESSNGVELMLYGKENVLKVVRSWGADRNSFTLLARKVDNVKSNMATLTQARRKLRKIRSLHANALSSEVDERTIQANLNKSCNKIINVKDIENATPANEKDKHSKLGLLKRFLSDVMLQKKKLENKRSRSRLATRIPGDSCYDSTEYNGRQSPEGIEYEREFLRHNSYLNAAFVEGDDTTNSDTTDNSVIDLEAESAFEDESICELERNIYEMSESDSDEQNDSDLSYNEGPFCESDNTVIKCERIIDMFRKAELSDDGIEKEDDYLESFMNTLVFHSDSDEGMCSLESDSE